MRARLNNSRFSRLLAAGWCTGSLFQILAQLACLAPLAAMLILVGGASASAQTVTASYAPFPVTAQYQTSSQIVTLTFNSDTVLIGVSIPAGYPDFYLGTNQGDNQCPAGSYPAGTQCTVNVIFRPYLPGWSSSQAPIGRWAPLQVQTYLSTGGGQYSYQNLPLTGTGTHALGVITPGTISDLIGNDVTPQAGYAGDGGPASGARFVTPAAMAMDVLGNIYIADTGNNVVRLYYQAGSFPEIAGTPVVGNVYTIAGIGPVGGVSQGGAGTDGVLATQSALNGPAGVAVDAAGNLYISDTNNQAVRMVSATTGIITTVAGTLNASAGYAGDQGPATAAQLNIPGQIAVDGYGNLFIADASNDAVRVVYAGGAAMAALIATENSGATAVVGDIYTLAGGPANGPAANNGDGALATLADLNYPSGVAVDSQGDVYIADSRNNAVRRVDAVSGNISSVYTGSATTFSLSVDASDDIYYTLPYSCSVMQYNPTGNAGLASPVSTLVAGNGVCAATGDGGPATSAGLSGALGMVVDGAGNLYTLEPDGVRMVANTNTSFNFGTVNVGTRSPAQSVQMTNGDILPYGTFFPTGTQSVNFQLSPSYGPFSLVPYVSTNANVPDCDASNFGLGPGQSCGASFAFAPTADGGPFTAFASSYAGPGVSLTGSGTGPLPTVTLTGGPLSFTAVAHEGTSASQPLYLTNTSNIAVALSQLYFTGYGFGEKSDTCGFSTYAANLTLAPGAACEIDVAFSPTTTGVVTGTANVLDNASSGGGQQSASLSGTGLAPVGTFSVSEVIVNALPGATATEAFNLTNTGTAPLNINPASWAIAGYDPARFTIASNTCGSMLAVGAYCTVTVAYSPLTYAYYSADLSVQDDTGGARIITQNGVSTFLYNTQTLHMVGTTGLPSRTALYYQTNYTFGTVAVGQSATQTVAVTLNTAEALRSISVFTGFTEFTVGTVTGCVMDGVTVNPIGTVCQVPVTFTPQWPGFRTAPMVVTDVEGGVGIPYTFPMTGIGAGSVAAMTPGIISTIVGGANGHADGIAGADGPATNALVSFINGYAIDPIGNQFISDSENDVIWKVDTSGNIHLYAGTPFPPGGYTQPVQGDGGTALGSEIGFGGPLALDSRGGLYLGDDNSTNYGQPTELRYIDSATNSIINFVGFTVPATWSPNTAFGPTNRLQVNVNGKTYLFTAFIGGTTGTTAPQWPTGQGYGVFDGTVEWINQGLYYGKAGCAAQTDAWGDGCLNSEATVGTVTGIALDRSGNLYFSDTGFVLSNTNPTTIIDHSMIRRVDAVTKIVTVVAGNGTYGYAGDGGQATAAEVTAGEMAFDSKGNLYFIDGPGSVLRRIDGVTGVITTVAGTQSGVPHQQGYCTATTGDEGPASAATFANLTSLAIDAADDIYLVDESSCHVRRIDAATGTMHNVAGAAGTYGNYGLGFGDLHQSGADGDATQAFLNQPGFVRLDGQANMYVASAFGGVRKIDVTQSVLNFTDANSTSNALSQQAVNTVSSAQTATVLNAGNSGAFSFAAPFLSGPAWGISSTNFLRDVTSPTGNADCVTQLSIAPGSICPVSVDFGPLIGGGWLTGVETVNDTPTAGSATQPIALYGYAGGATPLVTLTPFLLSFSTPQGGVSLPQVLTLTNNDVNPLPISSIAVSGTGAAAFTLGNNCGALLAAMSSCQIEVVSNPPVLPANNGPTAPPDNLQATVTVTDAAGNSPQLSQLIALGTLPSVATAKPLLDLEEIHITDSVSLIPATPLPINEVITVSDGMPSTVSATVLPINEVITVSDSSQIAGGLAKPSLTWPAPAAIGYGTALGPSQLDATASVAGTFAYTPAAGTVLAAGITQLSVLFTPTDTAHYTTATASVSLTVVPAPLTVSIGNASRSFDAANPAFTYSLSGFVNGDTTAAVSGSPVLSTTAVLNSPAGTYPITGTAGTLSASNYSFTLVPGTLTVTGGFPQTIVHLPIPNVPIAVGKLTLTAHSSSGIPVAYTVNGPATIQGEVLTLTGTGLVTVTATQPGNTTFAPATPVVRSFTVTP